MKVLSATIIAAAIVMGSRSAVAQQTKAQLATEIANQLPDNTSGSITPSTLRGVLNDMVTASGTSVDPNTWTQLQTFRAGLHWGPTTAGLPTLANGEIYFDQTNGFGEHNAALNLSVDLGASAPSSVIPSIFDFTQCQGNNTTFVGCSGLFIQTQDRSTVTALNKGVLYGLNVSVVPNFARNNSPFDDVAGLVVQNNGTGKATDALFVGSGPLVGSQWVSGILIATNVDSVFRYSGTANYGVDFVTGAAATFNNQAFRAPNNAWSGGRNAANSADVNAWRIDNSNLLELGSAATTVNPANGNVATNGTLQLGAVASSNGTITLIGSTSGSAVINSNSTGQLAITPSSGQAFILPQGGNNGQLILGGATSGFITLQPANAAAGTWNFNLPSTSGALGQELISGGGGSVTMGWFTPARVRTCVTGVNFNSANTDTALTLNPFASVRYAIDSVRLTNASASISTATVGVFTATGGGGQTVAANQAITVTATATDANNNTQSLTLTNGTTEAYNDATLQVRVGTAQGSAATGDVCVYIIPLT